MPSERIQRQIDQLLDAAEQAVAESNWTLVRDRCRNVLALDTENADAKSYLDAAERWLATAIPATDTPPAPDSAADSSPTAGTNPELARSAPASFANGRYTVKKFLGEGGKKKVYLAHDTLLDRDVAFALIKTEGLDEVGRDRITREAQAMGRLGSHPHIVSVFDLGEEAGCQPYIVTELMGGGDVEGLIEKAPEHRPPLERTLEIGIEICRGLEFAHSKGIVHRDLKPGNVWLVEDGTAKLGDFGLAVALDRSRLTQAGTMVGTVNYMPPEQAMGGEVTPRSDLYSLGAMLYELVTGRPPFVGDDSVAIIGQHLNTRPVAPTWHRPDCPLGLEALILRLLEKDPAKRPASASEVRTALVDVAQSSLYPVAATPSAQGPQEDELRPGGENPLYRRVFVGREQETKQLQAAYDAALSGQAGLAMVVGEPGIGKTALVEQLGTYATLRGGSTLWGHCYEEGSLSLPYLAFVEALRGYVSERPPEALRAQLGGAASDVARIVSEVRERLAIEPRPPSEPEEDRWRLLQAVSGFLRNASLVQPLVVVLEDLHWADQGTLDLLTHLARNLQGARLLIIGTYRDVEVDRSHPLSAALADLRRQASFGRVQLHGLGTPEVQRMLAAITGMEAPGSLAEAIHRQTEGNPLFVQEVVRYLVEEGHLGQAGQAASGAPGTMSIPEGLRDVIGRRIARLSPECNRLLAIAAVIGRDFNLATLRDVAGVEEESLVQAVEDATRVGVLEEQSRLGVIRYRFAHAFFRQTLYEELSAPRRLRFHQEVARVLEAQYANRLEEHAAELAEHFAQSTDREDLRKAVHYGELAAERALSVYAYGEAVRHLERALDVQEVLDPDDKAKRCDLLLGLGEALLPAGEPLKAAEAVAPQALELAEAMGDRRRASRSCRVALLGLLRWGIRTALAGPAGERWAELADRYAEAGTTERVFADWTLGAVLTRKDRVREGWDLTYRAISLAREIGDREDLFELAAQFLTTFRPQDVEAAAQIAEEISSGPRDGMPVATVIGGLWFASSIFLSRGLRDHAEALWQEMEDLETRTRIVNPNSWNREPTRATLDGDLERAVGLRAQILADAEAHGMVVSGSIFADNATFRPLVYLGRAEETRPLMPEREQLAPNDVSANRLPRHMLRLAHTGQLKEASGHLQRWLVDHRSEERAEDLFIPEMTALLEASLLLEDRDATEFLVERLAPAVDVAAMAGNTGGLIVLARYLGDAAMLLGEREEALRYYEQALDLATRMRHRPEIALIHLAMAEALLDDGNESERSEALQHLDTAIAELRDMKMQPALERALRHKEVLKA